MLPYYRKVIIQHVASESQYNVLLKHLHDIGEIPWYIKIKTFTYGLYSGTSQSWQTQIIN